MAFPSTPLDVRVDLQIGGVWIDVTADTLARDGASSITIVRGRSDEATRADPSKCDLKFKNQSGKYSPRNPTSPYYGLIGRNTPLRVGIGRPPIGAGTAAQTGTSIVAPTVTAEVTGELFCAWLAAPVGNLTTPGGFVAATELDGALSTFRTGAKAIAAGATGTSTATFSTAATAAAALSVAVPGSNWASTSGLQATAGGTAAFFKAGNAGDYFLAFYGWSTDPDDQMPSIADSEGGDEWTLIADTGPSAGPRIRAYIRRLIVAGPLAVWFYGNPRNTGDTFGQIYTLAATDYYPRFTGEVSSWPPKWDLSGRDVWVPVQASGMKRRLGAGATPLRSALARQLADTSGVVAYWPLEDGEAAASFASGLPAGSPMTFIGAPVPSAYDGLECADSVPTFTAAGAVGSVPTYPVTNQFAVGAIMHFPASGMVDETTLLTVSSTGTVATWTVKYEAGSTGFRVEAFTGLGVSVLNQAAGPWTPSLLDGRFFLYLTASVSGADIAWVLRYVPIVATGDGTGFSSTTSGTILTQTVGAVTGVSVGGAADLAGEPAIGHVVVTSTAAALFVGNVWQALGAWRSEDATIRFLRLCKEESVPCYAQGLSTGAAMGPQRPGTLLDLLGECEIADDGVIFEPKGSLGLVLRTRASKYNQAAELTLSYSGGNISEPFEPVDDDQGVINDVTVTRVGGSSARAELTSGPLSVLPPPFGIGRYDTDVPLNVAADAQLPDQAGWRVHVGTWDEARYPSIRVDLAKNPALIGTVTALDVGDLATVTGLPLWVPPGPVDLILEGYTETFGHPNDWDIVGNYSPGGPYRVLQADSATYGRADSLTSTLAAGVSSSATSLSVAVVSGSALWITTATFPAQFPFTAVVGGEEVTVTAITGTTSPQTWTVTRGANGISKAQPGGAQIRLARPVAVAL